MAQGWRDPRGMGWVGVPSVENCFPQPNAVYYPHYHLLPGTPAAAGKHWKDRVVGRKEHWTPSQSWLRSACSSCDFSLSAGFVFSSVNKGGVGVRGETPWYPSALQALTKDRFLAEP